MPQDLIMRAEEATLNAWPAPEAALFDGEPEAALFEGRDRLVICFADGRFDPARSSPDLTLAGVEIARLAEADRADIHWARDLYGTLESRGQSPVARPLAALNTAAATDGVLIRVTGRAAKPVHLVYVHESTSSDAFLHHVVRIEAGAELTLLETGPAAARFNKVLDEYKKAPDVTRRRLYLETMERVLGSVDKVIIDSKGGQGVIPYLPLDQLQKR